LEAANRKKLDAGSKGP
jgi:hypothetical protein